MKSIINRALAAEKKLFTLLLAVAASVGTMFAEAVRIGDLYYNLDATNQTAEVTYQYSIYSGDIIIPSSVTYNSVSYSVTSIGSGAFRGCTSLTSVTIPNSVTSIGESAFWGCTGLTSPVYNAHVFAYMPTSYSGSYTIPDGIESIAGGAFDDCKGLTSVTIPNSVTSIGNSAFSGCSGLTSVTIPNSVTSIGDHAFAGCTGLTSVTIGNSVSSIGEYAFAECSGLTSVTIPNSVTSIGDHAFAGCTGLTSVTNFANTPQEIDSAVFDNVDKSTCVLYVPAGSISAYQSADGWKDFTNILPISQQGVEEVPSDQVQSTKFLHNGQIYLLRGDKTYTLTGQEIIVP